MCRNISPPPQERVSTSPIHTDQSAGPGRSKGPSEHPTHRRSDASFAQAQAPKQGDSDDFHMAPRVSHVRILPTSLPYVHDQLMEQRGKEQRARADEREAQRSQTEDEHPDTDRKELSAEEQEATARALKPHSRSVVDLDKLRLEPPEGHAAPHQPKRSRKWQFGIRSRNQPYEAMLYLYRAIAAQGGVWEIQPLEAGSYCPALLLH